MTPRRVKADTSSATTRRGDQTSRHRIQMNRDSPAQTPVVRNHRGMTSVVLNQDKLARPGTTAYDDMCASWNARIIHHPDAVYAPISADDVASAVRFASENGMRIRVQNTGHGAEAACTDGMLIRTAGMRGVTVDPDAGTANVSAGAKWIDVISAAYPHGLAPICGSSSDVGALGFSLGQVARIHSDPPDPGPSIVSGLLLSHIDQKFASVVLDMAGPDVDTPFGSVEIRQLGEATARDVPEGSAVSGRSAAFTFGAVCFNPAKFPSMPGAIELMVDELLPWTSDEGNSNFMGAPRSAEQWIGAWPPPMRARLSEINRRYDPDHLFAYGPATMG